MKTKPIERDEKAMQLFNNRTLAKDYRHLSTIIKPGIQVLDIGCGTGTLSNDVAQLVGNNGLVVGIDNTEKFIVAGNETFKNTTNLKLIHADIFDFEPQMQFDLIISARTFQWLSHPKEALLKVKSLLKPNGQISILDYNHEWIEWNPLPPASMQQFYKLFLKWRADAGMDNLMALHLPQLMEETGFKNIGILNSDEHYTQNDADFKAQLHIWTVVAGSKQMVTEGYFTEDFRLQVIEEYNYWIENEAISMTLKMNEIRAVI